MRGRRTQKRPVFPKFTAFENPNIRNFGPILRAIDAQVISLILAKNALTNAVCVCYNDQAVRERAPEKGANPGQRANLENDTDEREKSEEK